MKRSPMKRSSKPMKRGTIRKKSRKLTTSKLRDKVWSVFSKYIRQGASVGGYCKCVTCGILKPIAETHAGHFIHSKTKATYLEEDNVHPQCPKCNMYLSGNLIEYTLFMLNEYGDTRVQELKSLAEKDWTWKRDYLEEKLAYYKDQLKELNN